MAINKRSVAAMAIVALAMSIAGCGFFSNDGGTAQSEADSHLAVETVNALQEDIAVKGEYIGTVEADRSVTVIPKASGEVLSVNFDVGDKIEAGDVLCEIDSKTFKKTIEQTEAALASAQAKANYSLEMAKNDLATAEYNATYGYETGVQSAEGAVASAQAGLESAQNRLRTATMSASTARRKLAAHRDYEDDTYLMTGLTFEQAEKNYIDAVRQAELAVDAAEIGLESAENGLAQAKETLKTLKVMSEEQRISAAARVQMSELSANLKDQYLALDRLKDDLGNYSVKSPISGVVEKRYIDPFGMASPQSALFVISDKGAMTVEFNVSEASLMSMKVGDKVSIDKNGKLYDGKISEIASSVDARSGLFTVKATVDNPPSELYNGSTAKVLADSKKAEKSLLLPIDTIYYEGGKPYVYVAENGAAKKVFVETGISDDEKIQILSGLTVNDAVIATWSPNLADGAAIKLGAEGE